MRADGRNESFTPPTPPFYLLSCFLPAATLTPKECIYNIARAWYIGKYTSSLCCTATKRQFSWSRVVRIATSLERHYCFEMLFEILRWNLIPRKVDDKGCCMRGTRSYGEVEQYLSTLPSAFNPWSNLTSEGTLTMCCVPGDPTGSLPGSPRPKFPRTRLPHVRSFPEEVREPKWK